jgi:exopolyphosphatase/guanosine-5'-triphosphate,3'-diphosphate pyrophosphatase
VPKSAILGAIDAGSNALRVIVSRYDDGKLTKLAGERQAVRLGHGAFTRGILDDQTIDAAVAAFRRFRELFDEHEVDLYRAVATSALRTAHNSDVLLHRLYHEADLEVEVISGEEEARLVRKAVTHAFGDKPAPRVILDLGGGSFEVNLRRKAGWAAASMPIGTVRLVETFDLTGAIEPYQEQMIRRAVRAMIDNFVEGKRDTDVSEAAACGGNAEALAELFGKPKGGMPALKVSVLEDVLPSILDIAPDARMKAFDVRRDRAEVMAVAAIVFDEAAQALGLTRLLVPGVGIRDAVLLDLAETIADAESPAATARGYAMLTAARTFAARVRHDTTHGEHVRELARALFDQLAELHELPAHLGIVLEVAALLHDIGVVVNGRGHHRHGAYMVSSGRITGLDSPDREMVSVLIRTHRKSAPDESKHPTYASLSKTQREQVQQLAAILRIADGLDTDHRQRVSKLVATHDDETVKLAIELRSHPDETVAPTHRKHDLFEDIFEMDVAYDVREK